MFSFLDHVFEIWTVSSARKVDVGVAYDMFRTDVQHGQALPYNTGEALPDFNFADAKTDWDELTEDEQLAAMGEYSDFIHANYTATCRAYPKGREALDALVSDWRGVTREDN